MKKKRWMKKTEQLSEQIRPSVRCGDVKLREVQEKKEEEEENVEVEEPVEEQVKDVDEGQGETEDEVAEVDEQ